MQGKKRELNIKSFIELELMLENMQYWQQEYKLIKKELKRRGNWKNKPRGKSFKEQG